MKKVQVEVYLLSTKKVQEHFNEYVEFLDREQKLAVEQFVDQNDKLLHIGSAYLVKKFTSGTLFYGEYGKPLKKGYNFNISHSGELVAFARAETNIGVDIEKIRHIEEKYAQKLFSDDEILEAQSNEDFIRLWTIKESLLKCEGKGITLKIKDVPAIGCGCVHNKKKYSRAWQKYGDYYLSVTLEGELDIKINIVSV